MKISLEPPWRAATELSCKRMWSRDHGPAGTDHLWRRNPFNIYEVALICLILLLCSRAAAGALRKSVPSLQPEQSNVIQSWGWTTSLLSASFIWQEIYNIYRGCAAVPANLDSSLRSAPRQELCCLHTADPRAELQLSVHVANWEMLSIFKSNGIWWFPSQLLLVLFQTNARFFCRCPISKSRIMCTLLCWMAPALASWSSYCDI